MILRPSNAPLACSECGSPLHADQRYCLRCGARHGTPRVDPLTALGFAAEAAAADSPASAAGAFGAPAAGEPWSIGQGAGPMASGYAPGLAGGGPGGPAGSGSPEEALPAGRGGRGGPSRRLSAALAAATLVVGAAVGAAIGPGPTPSVAAAPQRLVALVVPSPAAPVSTVEQDEPELPPTDEEEPETPAAQDSAPADDDAPAAAAAAEPDETTSTDDTSGDDTADDDPAPAPTTADDDPASASSTTPATAGTAPAHIWVVSLTQLDVNSAFAPASPLADLVAQGTLLSNYIAAGPSPAVNQVALLGGQVPTADCVAALAACVLPAGETSLPDQVATLNLPWRAYVEDPAQRCPATPAPNARVATSLFTTLTTRTDCATTTVGLDQLATDLATVDKTPALSLVVPDAAHDGSAPAGLTGVTAPLHALVAQITASPAYKADGVLIVVPDAPPAGSTAPLGALVLSPRATPAATVATATGPVALLRSLDELLGLDPLAAAAQAPAGGALSGVLATTARASASTFPHRSTPTTTTRRSP
jgi:hypothetical protein